MRDLVSSMVATDRLEMHVWASGPADGVPLLLVHGNLVTGGGWRYVAAQLPGDVRVIAPDLRGYGRTEAKPVDATRGLGDMADDLRSLLVALGLADRGAVNAAGWSMGGGVLWQYALGYPADLASLTMVAPLSPYGFGGTKGAGGEPCFADFAATGGGAAAPLTSPRVIMRQFFGARGNAAQVDEEFLLDEVLRTRTGDDFSPGDATASPNWPGAAPGKRGIFNAISPKWYNTSAFAGLARKPPVTWLRGGQDRVGSAASMFALGYLGQLGAVPGWPGDDVLPPQPMDGQTRAVLDAYRAGGGVAREVVLADAAQGMPVEVPERVAEVIAAQLAR